MLEKNIKAPEFSLPDENGVIHTLKEYLGKKVVLYFYPKDSTSGCTEEALGFKALYEEFKNENTVILGVSKDSVKSHLNFKNKQGLPFTLLSDESLETLYAYDVYKEKSMYGRKYMGIVRSTFVIDENGMIMSADYNVKPKESPVCSLNLVKEVK